MFCFLNNNFFYLIVLFYTPENHVENLYHKHREDLYFLQMSQSVSFDCLVPVCVFACPSSHICVSTVVSTGDDDDVIHVCVFLELLRLLLL